MLRRGWVALARREDVAVLRGLVVFVGRVPGGRWANPPVRSETSARPLARSSDAAVLDRPPVALCTTMGLSVGMACMPAPQVGQRDFDRVGDGGASTILLVAHVDDGHRAIGEQRFELARGGALGALHQIGQLGGERGAGAQRIHTGHVVESRRGQSGCGGVFLARIDDHHDGVIVITDRGGVDSPSNWWS